MNYSSYEPGFISTSYSAYYDSSYNTFNVTKQFFGSPLPSENSQVVLSDLEEDKLFKSLEPVVGINFSESTCYTEVFCPRQNLVIVLNNQTNSMEWTGYSKQVLNTLYNFEIILEEIQSSKKPVEMPPFFPNNLTSFSIDFKKTFGGIVPGQFIQITYNSTNFGISIDNGTGKVVKGLSFEDKVLLRDYVIRNDLIDIDLQNDECKWANCNMVTLKVKKGSESNTITYTDQSEGLLDEIQNVQSVIHAILRK